MRSTVKLAWLAAGLAARALHACAGGDPPYYATLTLVEPGVLGDANFAGDFRHYAYDLAHEQGVDSWDLDLRDPYRTAALSEAANLQEWQERLAAAGLSVSPVQVEALVHGHDVDYYGRTLDAQAERAGLRFNWDAPGKAQKAAWRAQALQAMSAAALAGVALPQPLQDYFAFSRQAEAALQALTALDGYDYERTEAQRQALADAAKQALPGLLDQAETAAAAGDDDFLRLKYAFQALRLADAAEQWDRAARDWRTLGQPRRYQGLTRARAMGYAARACVRLKQDDQARALYLSMHTGSPALRARVVQSVALLDARATLAWAQAQPGRLAQVDALYLAAQAQQLDDDLGVVGQVVQLGPDRSASAALMIQRVQRLEAVGPTADRDALLGLPRPAVAPRPSPTPADGDFVVPESHRVADQPDRYAPWVRLCEAAAAAPTARQKGLWLGLGAYLSLREGSWRKARVLLDQAEALPAKPLLQRQLHAFETLYQLGQAKAWTPQLQARLADDVAWAQGLRGAPQAYGMLHTLWVLAAQKCLLLGQDQRATAYLGCAGGWQGDSVRFMLEAGLDEAALPQLAAFLAHPGDGALDRLAAAQAGPQAGAAIRRMRLVRVLRREDYAAGLALLAQGPVAGGGEGASAAWRRADLLPDAHEGDGVTLRRGWGWVGDPQARETLTLKDYMTLMAGLKARLEASQRQHAADWPALAYQRACLLSNQRALSGPQLRQMEHSWNPNQLGGVGLPFDLPGVGEAMKAKAEAWSASLPSYNALAQALLRTVADQTIDRELAARAVAVQGILLGLHDEDGYLTPLRRLGRDFKGTAFYQGYLSRCEWLTKEPVE